MIKKNLPYFTSWRLINVGFSFEKYKHFVPKCNWIRGAGRIQHLTYPAALGLILPVYVLPTQNDVAFTSSWVETSIPCEMLMPFALQHWETKGQKKESSIKWQQQPQNQCNTNPHALTASFALPLLKPLAAVHCFERIYNFLLSTFLQNGTL